MVDYGDITAQEPLVLVGCGKMGGSLLKGWLEQGLAKDAVIIVEPNESAFKEEFGNITGLRWVPSQEKVDVTRRPALVLFAIKPQVMNDVVGAFSRFVKARTCFLSIAAGKPIGYFESRLGPDAAVVRAMPNTPAAVGRGITALCKNEHVITGAANMCADLMSAVGDVVWVRQEEMMDAVTAVSGSGPAYVFYLVECLTKAGMEQGLTEEVATRLARATIAGAGALVHDSSEDAAILRRNVTSPNGTTEAALEILMSEKGLEPLIREVVAAAAKRSRELAE